MARKEATAKKIEVAPVPRVVGDKVEHKPLSMVKPNSWNPNEFSKELLASLKAGLLTDGWLLSQALLVWGTDEKGKTKNIIIDGEHRWEVGTELGFKKAPMVFLHGLTEAKAKALTIKLDQKRGKFNDQKLGELLRQIQVPEQPELAFDLGLSRVDFAKFLAMPPLTVTDIPGLSLSTPHSATRTPSIQLTFTKKEERDKVKAILARRAHREDEPFGDVLHRTLKELQA